MQIRANKYSPDGGTVTVRVQLEDELVVQNVLHSDRYATVSDLIANT